MSPCTWKRGWDARDGGWAIAGLIKGTPLGRPEGYALFGEMCYGPPLSKDNNSLEIGRADLWPRQGAPVQALLSSILKGLLLVFMLGVESW